MILLSHFLTSDHHHSFTMGGSAAGVDPKRIHPFFVASKTAIKDYIANTVRPVTPDPSCSPNSDQTNERLDGDDGQDHRRRKRRKTDSSAQPREAPTKRTTRVKHQSRASTGASHFGQKQDATTPGSNDGDVEDADMVTSIGDPASKSLAPAQPSTLNSGHPTVAEPDSGKQQDLDSVAKPSKMLKFNPKTGTIGSPPKPKPEPRVMDEEKNISKFKPTRIQRGKKPTSFPVCISYGTDDESRARIAEKIEDILSSDVHTNSPDAKQTLKSTSQSTSEKTKQGAQKTTPKKLAPKKDSTLNKPTHPFFTGKLKTDSSTCPQEVKDKLQSPVKRVSIFTSTPCSPKHTRPAPAKVNLPQFGIRSGGLKVPGAQHPAWPWQGIAHVRGDVLDEQARGVDALNCTARHFGSRKAKGQQISIMAKESVVHRATDELMLDELVEELEALDTDDFQPPPSTVRIPDRHFESGKKLQRRVTPELRTFCPRHESKAHPAVVHAYHSVGTSLSAFDQSTCENIAWAQKYAPTTADKVLQSGREAELLRDWLQTLKVQSVHTGVSDAGGSKSKQSGKKKRKRRKLDGFVVSSDEEEGIMDVVSEEEEDWGPNGKKTVFRAGDKALKDSGRLTNAVLLSGPHGCGKTATVYAIAKELDFEIFEINPGSRRNGQDILEKIGDMTRNHLVQHKQNEVEADAEDLDDEVARDLKSGKQGMMTAFFKPNSNPNPKIAKKPGRPPAQPNIMQQTKKVSGKTQKQSLILLEEVDILYKDDKQFWATVIGLMAQSKRPFIMTCNDESLIPLQSLNLHGIFRFDTPPTDPAIDLLLLIAANEGHALKREAVESLYESRQHDLRASITELNYWCQIGVGDVKGGFDWLYKRWPKGTDLDKEGNRIRVVSSDTYQTGMGWLGRDAVVEPSVNRTVEEEILEQTWESWNLDTSDFQVLSDQMSWAHKASSSNCSREERLASLSVADNFFDLMSIADVSSLGAYSGHNGVAVDATLPDLAPKSRDDFIIGRQLVDAQPLTKYKTTGLQITSNLRSLARAQLQPKGKAKAKAEPVNETTAIIKIHDSFENPPYTVPSITRSDYSIAFDPIAASDKHLSQSSGYLDPSVFDRTMKMITLDIAPYVRSIVAYDQHLQEERRRRSNLLSEGGKARKKMRTTRSALSALEGGSRASTRREKYFSAEVNTELVMRTGGKGWDKLALGQSSSSSSQSTQSSDDEMDTSPG